MFCLKCGKEIVKKSVFCPYCGARLNPAPDSDNNAQNMDGQTSAPSASAAQQNNAPNDAYGSQQQYQQFPQQNQYTQASQHQQAPQPQQTPPPPQSQAPQYQQSQGQFQQTQGQFQQTQGQYQQPQGQYQQPQAQYQQPPAQAAAPRKKNSSKFVIPLIIAVVLIAAAVLLIVFKPWESSVSSPEETKASVSKPAAIKTDSPSDTNDPVITDRPDEPTVSEEPSFKVNDKEIPLGVSALGYGRVDTGTDGFYACFCGKKDDEIFGVNVVFMLGYPQSNSEYKQLNFGDNMAVFFSYSGKDYEMYSDGYYYPLNVASYNEEMSGVKITVGDFVPNEYITIEVSGKVSYDGLKYDFSATGKLDFHSNLDSYVNSWYENNRIPQKNSNQNSVTIGGESYPTDLTFLDLSGKGLSDEDLKNIVYMTDLERIELSDNNLYDISILRNLTTLTEIDADNNHISDISFLKDLPNIEIVVMNNNMISDISVFQYFSRIKKIWMCDNPISDITYIAKNTGMLELGFNNCSVTDLSAIREMTKLQMLHLGYCGITDISPLSNCTSLTELNLSGNNISDYSPIENLNIENIYY